MSWNDISKTTDQGFILMETEAFLLQETGGRITLETEDYNSFQYLDDKSTTTFANPSRNTTVFTNISKS